MGIILIIDRVLIIFDHYGGFFFCYLLFCISFIYFLGLFFDKDYLYFPQNNDMSEHKKRIMHEYRQVVNSYLLGIAVVIAIAVNLIFFRYRFAYDIYIYIALYVGIFGISTFKIWRFMG